MFQTTFSQYSENWNNQIKKYLLTLLPIIHALCEFRCGYIKLIIDIKEENIID